MKLKINKACDLSSISVLPPHTRRSNSVSSGLDSSSIFVSGKMTSQIQSHQQQLSQPTISQGCSSQPGLFSQFSQNSQDDTLTNEKFGSQERDLSVRRASFLPPISYTRDESQMVVSRTSNSQMRKLSCQEYKCQVSEELDRRIGMIETSLTRLGIVLDSVQSDIMQVHKGTKEIALDTDAMRQKLVSLDGILQTMSKGQEEIKAQLDQEWKSVSDQLKQIIDLKHFTEINSILSALSDKIDAKLFELQSELLKSFQKEIQEVSYLMKSLEQKQATFFIRTQEAMDQLSSPPNAPNSKKLVVNPSTNGVSRRIAGQKSIQMLPKIEMGGWTTVKQKAAADVRCLQNKSNHIKMLRNQVEERVLIESDEEIDGGFSCLLKERETVQYSMEEAKKETAKILRKARRRKRKYCNTIIIN